MGRISGALVLAAALALVGYAIGGSSIGGSAAVNAAKGGFADEAAAQTTTANRRRPILLMFHAGGFLSGNPSILDRAAGYGQDCGFETVQVAYPLGDPVAALRKARRVAKTYAFRREVCVYGESAGGALAARLAQARLGVDNCATYSPLVDVTTFGDGLFAQADRVRVLGRASRAPILALVAESENPGYARDIRKWARGDQRVRLQTVSGGHLGHEGQYRKNMQRAMRWLERKCGR